MLQTVPVQRVEKTGAFGKFEVNFIRLEQVFSAGERTCLGDSCSRIYATHLPKHTQFGLLTMCCQINRLFRNIHSTILDIPNRSIHSCLHLNGLADCVGDGPFYLNNA